MILEHKGTSIFYTDQGKGSAILLLHGFLENSSMWVDVEKSLVENHRVICIDLLGHGQSGCIGYVHTTEQMAEAVYAVVMSLKLDSVLLIGHSMGGYVALAFADVYTHMVKGVCLMNSTAQADSTDRRQLRIRANKMAQNNFENLVRMSVGNLFKQESLDQFPEAVLQVKEEALTTSIQGYIAANEGMRIRLDRTAVLLKLKNIFYIIGKCDPVINAASVIDEALKVGAKYKVLKGGHMSHVENKKELIDALRNFVGLV